MKNIPFLYACILTIVFGCEAGKEKTDDLDAETTPTENHRPQFHFTPPRMWMNDPNGMVYHKGEYHLFYQHYPDSTVWGPMHWGHAVSKDLMRWEHLPIALYPDSLGYIFSGSAIVDKDNTSGLGTRENPPIIAIYTYHDEDVRRSGRNDFQTQGIAFSTDEGRTWKKYEGNPVLNNPGIEDFRDPKVFWHEGTKMWIMILAVRDHVEFYNSKDLKHWEKSGEFGKAEGAHGGVWECPDLFSLTIDGDQTQKWIMLVSINPGGIHGGSATQYFIGSFDGKTFTNKNPASTTLWVDYGKDNYAGVTWSNIADDNRIFLGWMSNWQYANVVPTEKWRSAMTIPRTLHLVNTPSGIRVGSRPVVEIATIRQGTEELASGEINGNIPLTDIPFDVSTSEMLLEFELADENVDVGIELSNEKGEKLLVGFDAAQNSYYIDRRNAGKKDFSDDFAGIHYAPRVLETSSIKLHLILDVASAELFADDGTAVITDIFFPQEVMTNVSIFSKGGRVNLKAGRITRLASIW